MTADRDVVITGAGIASPLGFSLRELSDNVLAGRSGIRPITKFDVAKHPCRFAGYIDAIPCPSGWSSADLASRDHLHQLVIWCAVACLRDSGLWETRHAQRIGLVLGIGCEWMERWEADLHSGGKLIFDASPGQRGLSQYCCAALELDGPRVSVATACASGNTALSVGRDLIRNGVVDVCLAGSIDMPVSPVSMACFGKLGALSTRNETPAAASRPFDKNRDGFVMADGGAIFALETRDRATKRSAPIYATIAGYGSASDAFNMVSPSDDPNWAALAVKRALADAGIGVEELDYVNAHGTSTPAGDGFEALALFHALGDDARRVPISATKSMTGHMLSGAAAIEAAICLVAFQRQALPPTINLDEVDPRCELNHVAHQAQERKVTWAMSNSFGFGGSNTCLILKR